jgi:hypothetical protein
MYKRKITFLAALLLGAGYLTTQGQSKQDREYQEEATQIKQEIWDGKDPAFQRTDIPEKYSNESAVIIAMKFSLGADHSHRKDHIFSILHERVKIQDKAALENYSEFNLQKLRSTTWNRGYKLASYMGIRVIKPNGEQRDVDMNDAVSVKDERDDKKQKIAIPDLQVGDIIDYYMRINKDASSYYASPDPMDFSIGEKYPILDFSLQANVYKKMGVSWRYLNDDTAVLKRRQEGDDYVFSIHKTDIPRVTDERWLYEQRSLPTLRLAYVGLENNEFTNGMNENRIRKFLTYEVISVNANYPSIPYIIKSFGEVLNSWKTKHGKVPTDTELAELAYYYVRYASLYRENSVAAVSVGQSRKLYTAREHYVANAFRQLLKEWDINTELAAAVPRSVGTLQDVVSLDDLDYFIIAYPEGKPMYFYMSSMFSFPNDIPTELEGQEAYTVAVTGSSKEKDASFKKITLPLSTADQNVDGQKLNISFVADNLQQLTIDRIIRARGQYRYDYANLLLYEDMLKEERETLNSPSTLDYDLASFGPYANRRSEYTSAFKKAREDMDDEVKAQIANDYGVKPTAVSFYKVAEQGLEKDHKPFTMNETFTMDGFVKRAGNNYLLEVGKLIPEQIELSPEERKRVYDVNMPFSRTVSYDIQINIPQGYSVEGIENLNKSVSNDAGSFECVTKMVDGKLVLNVKKVYRHQHEAAANWAQMMAFMDAAADFNKQKVLLKKM